MTAYKYRTLEDVRRLTGALAVASRHCRHWATLCQAAADVVEEGVATDEAGAARYGTETLARARDEFERAIELLEPAVVRLLNEPRRPGESPLEYMQRVDELAGPDEMGLLRAMKARGLMLTPW